MRIWLHWKLDVGFVWVVLPIFLFSISFSPMQNITCIETLLQVLKLDLSIIKGMQKKKKDLYILQTYEKLRMKVIALSIHQTFFSFFQIKGWNKLKKGTWNIYCKVAANEIIGSDTRKFLGATWFERNLSQRKLCQVY